MTALVQEEAEVTRRQPDPADPALPRIREQRYQRRASRIRASRWIDPTLADLLLERDLVNATVAADLLGVTPQRIHYLRMPVRHRRPTRAETAAGITTARVVRLVGPHPSLFPDHDAITGTVAGKTVHCVEIGRLREWALQSGRARWDTNRRQLVPRKPRVGRPRRLAVTRSKDKS